MAESIHMDMPVSPDGLPPSADGLPLSANSIQMTTTNMAISHKKRNHMKILLWNLPKMKILHRWHRLLRGRRWKRLIEVRRFAQVMAMSHKTGNQIHCVDNEMVATTRNSFYPCISHIRIASNKVAPCYRMLAPDIGDMPMDCRLFVKTLNGIKPITLDLSCRRKVCTGLNRLGT